MLLLAGGCELTPIVPELFGDRYERCTDPKAQLAWRSAQSLQAQGAFSLAAAELATCVRLCPGHVPYHVAYQDVAHGLPAVAVDGQPQPAPATRAMLAFYQALPDDGRSPLPPFFQARLQRLQRREAPAQALLQQALQRDARFYFAHHELGLIWFGIGRPSRAAEHFRKAVAIRPGFVQSRLQLARCYVELWEWPRAAEEYRGYLAARPDDLVALRAYLSLIIYRVDGYLPEARAALRRLQQVDGADLDLRMDDAALTWKEGRLPAAAALYREVLARDHRHARASLNLGNLYYELGRRSEGEARRQAWGKARNAYEFFRSLGTAADAYDWFDLHLASPARLREIDQALGARPPGPITWRDL